MKFGRQVGIKRRHADDVHGRELPIGEVKAATRKKIGCMVHGGIWSEVLIGES